MDSLTRAGYWLGFWIQSDILFIGFPITRILLLVHSGVDCVGWLERVWVFGWYKKVVLIQLKRGEIRIMHEKDLAGCVFVVQRSL